MPLGGIEVWLDLASCLSPMWTAALILTFADVGTDDIFNGRGSKHARKVLPTELHPIAKRKLTMLALASQLVDLKVPPADRLEKLRGPLSAFHSIRINDQWRIMCRWSLSGVSDVQILDYH